ncbi:MAG: methionine adenosyltransferase [Erysipelotrichaceae bacterium]|nr:methionine adenosyltransferase [Erysipelotrichaceae bacterium]
MKRLFTSESVTEGHPDKVCDQISDAIVDAILAKDPNGRVAAETTVNTGYAMVMGEITTECYVDIPKLVREVICDIGYDRAKYGFDGTTCAVMTSIDEQSPDIAMGVDEALEYKDGSLQHEKDALEETGAGDQGIMFGYACDETEELMPYAIITAHKLARRLEEVRRTDSRLRPDGKTQVTVRYVDGVLKDIDTIVISTQHTDAISQEELHDLLIEKVIRPVVDEKHITENTKYLINPSGSFIIGGSFGDSGTTGRKIVVDTYGGYAPIGGGCFSSKDPTKVDRSAAYYARYVCRNIVANGLAHKCQLELSYAIGKADPVSVYVQSFGTSKYTDDELQQIVLKNFSFSVADIINELDLRRPMYRSTTNYGHFGKKSMPWEQFRKIEL